MNLCKLIAFDCDGTLLTDDGLVLESTKVKLKEAHEKGIKMCFASGRDREGIDHVAEQIGLKDAFDYYICFGGGKIIDIRNNSEVARFPIHKDKIQKIWDIAKNGNFEFYIFGEKGVFGPSEICIQGELEAGKNDRVYQQRKFEDISENEDLFKIVVAGEYEKLNNLEKQLNNTEIFTTYNISRSATTNLEFASVLSDKGKSLRKIEESMEIGYGHTAAFGDGGNDISMITSASLGVVMGNADDSVKKYADYITDTNNKGGIAKAMEEKILRPYREISKKQAILWCEENIPEYQRAKEVLEKEGYDVTVISGKSKEGIDLASKYNLFDMPTILIKEKDKYIAKSFQSLLLEIKNRDMEYER